MVELLSLLVQLPLTRAKDTSVEFQRNHLGSSIKVESTCRVPAGMLIDLFIAYLGEVGGLLINQVAKVACLLTVHVVTSDIF
jgi:hypothetical protein